MRDIVIPYNTMSYDTVKPPSNGWVGETHQEFNRIKIRLVGFTRPTTDPVAVNGERDDLSAALALAATVAGEFYFRSADRRNSPRSRRRIFPRRMGGTSRLKVVTRLLGANKVMPS